MRDATPIYTMVHAERLGFAARLAAALRSAGYKDVGPSEVARLYNEHCPTRITHHAVQKWFRGEAIPSQSHLICLSEWLQCDRSWLRFGESEGPTETNAFANTVDSVLLRDLAKLDANSKSLVRALVAAMLAQAG